MFLLLLLLLQDMKQYSSSQFARMLKIAVWCLTSPEKHFSEVRHDTQINLTLRTRWWLHCITRSRECDARLVVSMGEQVKCPAMLLTD